MYPEYNFQQELEGFLQQLNIQYERILDGIKFLERNPLEKPNVHHDLDFYFVLLRRIYRITEDCSSKNSNIANLKGNKKYRDLYSKIKIRDHVEHPISWESFPPVRPGSFLKVKMGLLVNKSGIFIDSGDQRWNLEEDNKKINELVKEMINFYPKLRQEFKELVKARMELLIEFINSDMKVDKFLDKDKPLQKNLLNFSKVIDVKTLGDSYNHEMEHKKVWDKYKVKSEFREDLWGGRFTSDVDFDEFSKNLGKEEIIKILSEICYAAYGAGHKFYNCETDLVTYDILCGKQKNYPLTSEDRKRMEKVYMRK